MKYLNKKNLLIAICFASALLVSAKSCVQSLPDAPAPAPASAPAAADAGVQ